MRRSGGRPSSLAGIDEPSPDDITPSRSKHIPPWLPSTLDVGGGALPDVTGSRLRIHQAPTPRIPTHSHCPPSSGPDLQGLFHRLPFSLTIYRGNTTKGHMSPGNISSHYHLSRVYKYARILLRVVPSRAWIKTLCMFLLVYYIRRLDL